MLRKVIFRCCLACALLTAIVIGAVATCGMLACSQPNFYSAKLANPDDADLAMQELERVFDALKHYVSQSSAKRAEDAFAIALEERHVNALLSKQFADSVGDLRLPRVSLESDVVRFATTVATDATDLVFSCDFRPTKTDGAGLEFAIDAVRVGKLPLPVNAILRAYLRTKPKFPPSFRLHIDDDVVKLTVNTIQNDAKLSLETLNVVDGQVQLTVRRTNPPADPNRQQVARAR